MMLNDKRNADRLFDRQPGSCGSADPSDSEAANCPSTRLDELATRTVPWISRTSLWHQPNAATITFGSGFAGTREEALVFQRQIISIRRLSPKPSEWPKTSYLRLANNLTLELRKRRQDVDRQSAHRAGVELLRHRNESAVVLPELAHEAREIERLNAAAV